MQQSHLASPPRITEVHPFRDRSVIRLVYHEASLLDSHLLNLGEIVKRYRKYKKIEFYLKGNSEPEEIIETINFCLQSW